MSSRLEPGSEDGLRSRSSERNDNRKISQIDHKKDSNSHNSHTYGAGRPSHRAHSLILPRCLLTFEKHVQRLKTFIGTLDLKDITLFCQD